MSGLAAKHQGAREGNEFAEGVAHHTIRATARGLRGGRFPPASLMRRNGASYDGCMAASLEIGRKSDYLKRLVLTVVAAGGGQMWSDRGAMPEPAKVFEDRVQPGDWRLEWLDVRGSDLLRPERAPAADEPPCRSAKADLENCPCTL